MSAANDPIHVLVVGSGPAGLSAAAAAAEAGLRVAVVDEFPEPGGRLLGQFHRERRGKWWVGRTVAERLYERCLSLGVSIRCGVTVLGITGEGDGWSVLTPRETLRARRLLLATGSAEVPVPVPGWTLPGVMSVGAVQVLANVHRIRPGRRGWIVGVNALGLAIASELAAAGIPLSGIALPPRHAIAGASASPEKAMETLLRLSSAAPSLWLRSGGRLASALGVAPLAAKAFPRRGLRLMGLPLRLRTAITRIGGTERVEYAVLTDVDAAGQPIPGTEREEAADFIALAGGLTPLAELASAAGCPFRYIPALGGHVPVHSECMRTPLEGLYVAGNITGVEGAQVAMAQGELAAVSICCDEGVWEDAAGQRYLQAAKSRVHQARAAAPIQFHPLVGEARRTLYADNESAERRERP